MRLGNDNDIFVDLYYVIGYPSNFIITNIYPGAINVFILGTGNAHSMANCKHRYFRAAKFSRIYSLRWHFRMDKFSQILYMPLEILVI